MIYKGQKCELGGNLVLQDGTTVEVTERFILNNIVEFAKGEGIEVGMELPSDLITAWFEHNNPNVGTTLDRRGKVTSIGRNPFYEIGFELDKARDYNLIGFKDFRDEWEAKQKEFKVGKWYMIGINAERVYINITSISESGIKGYGFDIPRCGDNNMVWSDITISKKHLEHLIPADTDKVKELLLEKAKNDYPIGTKFRRIDMSEVIFTVNEESYLVTNDIHVVTPMSEWRRDYKNGLSNPPIYQDGKFAEIIKDSEQSKGYLKIETAHGTIKELGDIELSI